MYMF
jgi:hypothetical protein